MSRKYLLGIIVTGVFVVLSACFFDYVKAATLNTPEIQAIDKEIDLRKKKIQQLEETISKYKQIITQKETETVSLKNQLGIITNRIAQHEADIELTEEKIKENQLEIDALNISISEKKVSIDKQKKIVSKMVENIHATDQKNYFEVMLTYETFSDFYNDIRYTENIYVDLGRSVKSLRIASEELETKKDQVETKKKKYEELKSQLEQSRNDLEGQEAAKEQLLTETKSSEARYRTLLANQKSQYQQIENEQRAFEDKKRKQLEAQEKIVSSGSVLMSWPVISRVVNASFHDEEYPFKKVFQHSGIDIRASYGTPVKAAASGYVARARRCSSSSCYAYVLIIHTGNISTVYGHLSNINVDDDAFVNRGDIIGYSGGTPGTVGAGPFVTGPHLHFEVRSNGIPVDPMPYMAP
jgi:murein DD-endopeptidase MepM/ murein hydrolase activator NlpD